MISAKLAIRVFKSRGLAASETRSMQEMPEFWDCPDKRLLRVEQRSPVIQPAGLAKSNCAGVVQIHNVLVRV